MPFSTGFFKQETKDYILKNYSKSIKILDIGAGAGTYYDMLSPEGYTNIDCVEVFLPYVIDYKLNEKYKKVILGDINKLDINFDEYDLIILGDVLEHISLEDAKNLLKKIKNSEVIVCVPFNSSQGVHYDNIHEIHLQDDLTFINFFERFEEFKPFCLRFDYGIFTKKSSEILYVETEQSPIPKEYQDYIKLNFNSYEIVEVSNKNKKNLDIIKKDLVHLSEEEKNDLIKFLSKKQLDILNNELTVVTGLWNINRPGRDFNHYIENFKKFLEIPIKMFIYIPKEYEYLVWEKRSKENTYVKIFELSDVQELYKPHWDKTQEIRTNPNWYNQTGEGGWLVGSPQAHLEWYNPIVQSKMFLLHSASIWDPFASEYFIWLDAGITNTVYEKFFTESRVLDKINKHLDTFLFLSYPYETNDEIHGFSKKEMDRICGKNVKYVCRGGLFGGRKYYINEANADYYALLQNTLSGGFMGTEESVFSIMAHLNPYIYRRYELDGNGLIVKYVQSLLDDKAELVPLPMNTPRIKNPNPSLTDIKMSLYMLTFNFPEQVEHTLRTFEENSKDWLEKPRKILIDNSTNEEARIANRAIADKWGFEHIIRNENTGINGGRLFAAEHFQESDSDYYIFFEDDMGLHPSTATGFCRNGFRQYIPNLYNNIQKIMIREDFDFLKLSFTEVYMDNHIQVSWYNVPQAIRTRDWPDYDKLPISGFDPNAPRTKFDYIDVFDGISYISGNIYYANWPTIVGKVGNQKMFLDVKWAHPYEQTWMSYIYQEACEGKIKPGILLASPVNHNRISHYKPEDRREN